MTSGLTEYLAEGLAPFGLFLRGGFVFGDDDDAPAGPDGKPARSLLLVGNVGGSLWPAFSAWSAEEGRTVDHPLDAWTRLLVDPVAQTVGARAVYPFEKPWQPFQRWAMRAEGSRPSPLGILMHPEFGLWHAYRAALLFDVEVENQVPRATIHPCDQCVDKPCLTTCPIGAYKLSGFDVAACSTHLRSPALEDRPHGGCSARNACPVGAAYRYSPEQQAFHHAAFLRARATD